PEGTAATTATAARAATPPTAPARSGKACSSQYLRFSAGLRAGVVAFEGHRTAFTGHGRHGAEAHAKEEAGAPGSRRRRSRPETRAGRRRSRPETTASGDEVACAEAELAQEPDELFELSLTQAVHGEGDPGDGLRRFFDDLAALVGDLGQSGTAVGRVGHPAEEALGLEPVDDVGDRGGMDHQPLAHLAQRQRPLPGEL